MSTLETLDLFELAIKLKKLKTLQWKDKKGNLHKVLEMNADYLQNVIDLLDRKLDEEAEAWDLVGDAE